LAKVFATLTPMRMAEYHRQLARIGVARVGKPKGWAQAGEMTDGEFYGLWMFIMGFLKNTDGTIQVPC
jgi:hypothetical protein